MREQRRRGARPSEHHHSNRDTLADARAHHRTGVARVPATIANGNAERHADAGLRRYGCRVNVDSVAFATSASENGNATRSPCSQPGAASR